MGFFDRIGRELSKGVGALGGFLEGAVPILAGAALGGIAGRVEESFRGQQGVPRGIRFPVRTPTALLPPLPGLPGATLPTGIPFLREEMTMPTFLPGGAQVAGFAPAVGGALGRLLPGIAGGLAAGGLFEGFFGGGPDLPTAPGVAPGGVFQVVGPTLRARSLFHITNPSTGREVWYRNVGQPVLFSGDLRTVKRVRRVARFARSAVSRKR